MEGNKEGRQGRLATKKWTWMVVTEVYMDGTLRSGHRRKLIQDMDG